MKNFIAASVKVFKAINGASVEMPGGYSGATPTLSIQGGDKNPMLVLDMQEALVFSLNNVTWSLTGGATYVSYSVQVVNGKLLISVVAT